MAIVHFCAANLLRRVAADTRRELRLPQ